MFNQKTLLFRISNQVWLDMQSSSIFYFKHTETVLFFVLDYEPVGKVGEGTFYHVLKAPTLRDGTCYAYNHMKPHFERYA